MENKINPLVIGLLLLVIGFLAGWLIGASQKEVPLSMHQMSDGSVMHNEDMSMNHMMMDMTAGLMGKTGDEFDKVFLDEMIVHHQGAVDMAKMVKQNSKRPEMLKFADDIITVQSREIQMMKGWRAAWFK